MKKKAAELVGLVVGQQHTKGVAVPPDCTEGTQGVQEAAPATLSDFYNIFHIFKSKTYFFENYFQFSIIYLYTKL